MLWIQSPQTTFVVPQTCNFCHSCETFFANFSHHSPQYIFTIICKLCRWANKENSFKIQTPTCHWLKGGSGKMHYLRLHTLYSFAIFILAIANPHANVPLALWHCLKVFHIAKQIWNILRNADFSLEFRLGTVIARTSPPRQITSAPSRRVRQ